MNINFNNAVDKNNTSNLLTNIAPKYFECCESITSKHKEFDIIELNYLNLKEDNITEIFLTPDTSQISYLVDKDLDPICPSREIHNYSNLPRQHFWSETNMLLQYPTAYLKYLENLKNGCFNPLLVTSFINSDKSISAFFHVVNNKLDAYHLFRNRYYILGLKSIEKELYNNSELIHNSTYKKKSVNPLCFKSSEHQMRKVRFTKREYSILKCIYNGLYSSKAIALELKCSYRTIDEYLNNLKVKLNVSDKYGLIMEISNNYLYY